MQKSVWLAALKFEFQRHDFSHFVEEEAEFDCAVSGSFDRRYIAGHLSKSFLRNKGYTSLLAISL